MTQPKTRQNQHITVLKLYSHILYYHRLKQKNINIFAIIYLKSSRFHLKKPLTPILISHIGLSRYKKKKKIQYDILLPHRNFLDSHGHLEKWRPYGKIHHGFYSSFILTCRFLLTVHLPLIFQECLCLYIQWSSNEHGPSKSTYCTPLTRQRYHPGVLVLQVGKHYCTR